jgi:hypothetical protein
MMTNVDELIDRLARDAAAVRPAPHPYALSLKWTAGAAAYLFLSLALTGLRPDVFLKLHQQWFAAEIAALFFLFAATSLSAALLSFPDMHQMRRLAYAPVVAFALFLTVVFLAWRADDPPAPLPPHSYECTVCIILVSLFPAAWTFHAMRKFASTHYLRAGVVALVSAFSVGALWLRLHEMNDSMMHVVRWHYLPVLAFGAAGLWLGKKLLRW